MGVHCFLGAIVLYAERCWRVLPGWTTYPSMPERVVVGEQEGGESPGVGHGGGATRPLPPPSPYAWVGVGGGPGRRCRRGAPGGQGQARAGLARGWRTGER